MLNVIKDSVKNQEHLRLQLEQINMSNEAGCITRKLVSFFHHHGWQFIKQYYEKENLLTGIKLLST